MDASQWQEGIGVVKSMDEKKPRPQKAQALNCPRCNSAHTKFCYYNNYSLSQPRYFCKTCRRYWTEGGSLRNVPVGGGSRKNNKRSSSSLPSAPPTSSSSKKLMTSTSMNIPDHHNNLHHLVTTLPSNILSQNPSKMLHESQDLNLAYPNTYSLDNKIFDPNNNHPSGSFPQFSAMEFLKSGLASRGVMSSFMSMAPMQMSSVPASNANAMIYASSGLNFTLDGFQSGYSASGLQGGGVQENGSSTSAKLFFPFEDLKSNSNEGINEQNRGQGDSNATYWNGGLSGGSWGI